MVKLNNQTREEYKNQMIQLIDNQDMKQFRELFFELHPTDQLDLFNSLSKRQRITFYKYVRAVEFAQVFQEIELEKQKIHIAELQQNYAIDVLNHMSDDDLADFLGALPEKKRYFYLSEMGAEEAQEVTQLLKYEDQTAGAIMTTEFIAVSSTEVVANVLEQLRGQALDAEMIYYLYVVDEQQKLVGVLSLRDLIVSSLGETIAEIMLTRIKRVDVNMDQEEVVRIFKKYNFLALPVTTDGKLVGIITVDDVMDVVDEETEEDFGEFVGGRGSLNANVSIFSAAKKRAPWLVLLLFFGIATGGIIGVFEETLEQYIMLSFFIPLIMGSAGNTGTQALAVVVRNLALGTDGRTSIKQIIKREFKTGMMLGIICAITLLAFIPFLYPEGGFVLAAIVGTSLFLTLCVSTIVGALIPIFVGKLKIDPAVASGPFITTINDITGLIIYFVIATNLLQFLP